MAEDEEGDNDDEEGDDDDDVDDDDGCFSARATTRALAFLVRLVLLSEHTAGSGRASHRADWSEKAAGVRESAAKGRGARRRP